MHRALWNTLIDWKERERRKPLLLRGARQVGKTYLVSQLSQEFELFHNINFELEPEYKRCFNTLKPKEILQAIALESGKIIEPHKSLLFLDEIQDCPNAIMALRYFKELMPELHIIGAGSLLEFAMQREELRMPVGRVQFMHLKPLSFEEFLVAHGYRQLHVYLKTTTLEQPPNETSHTKLLGLAKQYLALGGMPEVHEDYLINHELSMCQTIQTTLLNTYKRDFGKYASQDMQDYLQAVFTSAPHFAGKQMKYVDIDRQMRSRGLKKAITLLEQAGVLQRVYASQASGIPLNATLNEKRFKLVYVDVGLANRVSKIDIATLLREDLEYMNRGHITEQFVGQELLAYMPSEEEPELYYWAKDKPGSQAEVDFVIQHQGKIVPIEVKAGKTGRLKSLRIFMKEKQLYLGVRVSQKPLSLEDNILSVPYYMLSELPRLLDDCL